MTRKRLALVLAFFAAVVVGGLLLGNARAQVEQKSPLIEDRYTSWHKPQFVAADPAGPAAVQRAPVQPQELNLGAGDFTEVVYQAVSNGSWDVYRLDQLTYGTPVPLVVGSSDDFLPRLNTTRNKVVFVSNRSGNYDIFTVNIDGSGLRRLTFQNALDSLPAWSPDGSRIAFVSDRDGNPEVYLLNADGTDLQRLTYSAAIDLDPVFSPDGKKIAWVEMISEREGVIKVMNADGSAQQVILGPFAYVRTPAWSPGGEAIAMELDWDGDGWLDVAALYLDHLAEPAIHYGGFLIDRTMGSWISQRALITGNIYYTVSEGRIFITNTSFRDSSQSNEYAYPLAFYPWGEGDTQPPFLKLESMPRYTRLPAPEIHWQAADLGPAGINRLEFDYKEDDDFSISELWFEEDVRSVDMNALENIQAGDTYQFRLNALDFAGNESNPDYDNWDATTTYYQYDLYNYVYDPRGYPLTGVQFQSDEALFQPATDRYGFSHGGYLSDLVTISALRSPGVAPLQVATLRLPDISTYDWLTLPKVNYVLNGDFDSGSLTDWTAAGPAVPEVTTLMPNGDILTHYAAIGRIFLRPLDSLVTDRLPSNGTGALARVDDGTLLVFWTDNLAFPGDLNPNRENIFYSQRSPEGFWSAPQVLNPDSGQSASTPRVALDGSGVLHVLWVEYDAYTTRLRGRQRAADGSWSPVETLLQPLGSAKIDDLLIDATGRQHILILDLGELLYMERPAAGSWTAPLSLSPEPISQADLAVDPQGTAHVIYHRYPENALMHRQKPAGGSWQAAEVLQTDVLEEMALEIDAAGRWHLLYTKLIETDNSSLYYRMRTAAGAWRAPLRLDDPEIEDYVHDLNLVLQPDGNLWALWSKAGPRVRVKLGSSWTQEMFLYLYLQNPDIIPDGEEGLLFLGNTYPGQNVAQIKLPENASGSLAQTITLPEDVHAPTLALHLHGEETGSSGTFEILLNDTPVYSATAVSESWQPLWLDVSPWLGQQVTLTLRADNPSLTDALVVNLDDLSLGAWTTQVVEAVEPAVLPPNTQGRVLTIRGENFYGAPEVWLGAQQLTNVQVVDEHTLRATIPVRLPPGRYDLKVFQSGELENPVFNAVLVGTELFLPLGLR